MIVIYSSRVLLSANSKSVQCLSRKLGPLSVYVIDNWCHSRDSEKSERTDETVLEGQSCLGLSAAYLEKKAIKLGGCHSSVDHLWSRVRIPSTQYMLLLSNSVLYL